MPDFSGAPVLVVGDAMLDRFVIGHVDRVSPEAPVPILSDCEEYIFLGGAGNVLRNLTALGAKAKLVSVIGHDIDGCLLADMAHGENIHLLRTSSLVTTVKTRFVNGSQHLLRRDTDNHGEINTRILRTLIDICEAELDGAGALVISDYQKGVVTEALARSLIGLAKERGVPVVADSKHPDVARFAGARLLTPNCNELEAATGMLCDTAQAVGLAAKELLLKSKAHGVLATCGPDGMVLIDGWGHNKPIHIKGCGPEVVDVSGAGDTVVAVMAAGLAAGLKPEDLAPVANRAGAIVVGKRGTSVVTPAELGLPRPRSAA